MTDHYIGEKAPSVMRWLHEEIEREEREAAYEAEKDYICTLMIFAQGNLSLAVRLLRISPTTLEIKLAEYKRSDGQARST